MLVVLFLLLAIESLVLIGLVIVFVYNPLRVEHAVLRGGPTDPPIILRVPMIGQGKIRITSSFVFDTSCRYSQLRESELRFLATDEPIKPKPSSVRLHDGTICETREFGWTVVTIKLGEHAFQLHCLVVPEPNQNCLGCYPLLTKYDVSIRKLKILISKRGPFDRTEEDINSTSKKR